MKITLGSNISSLQAQRRLNTSSDTLSGVAERLASGLRINRASDDAAGLQVASALQAKSRIMTQALRNINDGVSMLSIADGAMNELSKVVERIAELAEQAANGVYSSTQREALDAEAQALRNEYNRVIETTSFNGRELFTSIDALSLQVGIDSSVHSRLDIGTSIIPGEVAGSGQFSGPTYTNITVGNAAQWLTVGDFNEDGFDDIYQHGLSSGGGVIMLSNGDGTLNASTYSGSSGNAPSNTADLNGDGNLDFVVNLNASLRARLGDGAGNFVAGPLIDGVTLNWTAHYLHDMNGDGRHDLVSSMDGPNDIVVRMGNGDGTFGAAITTVVAANFDTESSDLEFGDFDSDGNLDIMVSQWFFPTFTVLLSGNGDGTFAAPVTISSDRTLDLVGDFNNDGILDLLKDSGANVRVWAGDGAGNFSAIGSLIPTTDNRYAAYDINEDGDLDLVGTDTLTGAVNVRLGNGDGSFQNAIALTSATDSYDIKFGDFNGDSSIDIAISTYFNQQVAIYLGEAVRNPRMGEISLLDMQSARDTLTAMQSLQDTLSTARGNTGAYLSRLDAAANNMLTRRENTIAAASRITDVDIAAETAEYVRQSILQNVAASILAQANQQPSIALKLL